MGLIDLKTNLRSLKYGNDQKGGGSSNQPYIVTPIPDGFSETAPDFLLRNGYLNPLSSIQDVSRLTRMFLDVKSPNGLLFITKQELLERQNPIQANTDRVYSPLNTLAQAGVVSTGYHLNKQGLNPFTPGYYNGGRSGYFFSTLAGSNVDGGINGGENRLTLLYTSKVADQSLRTFTINPFGVTGPGDSTNLLSYSGGPNSVLGFGKTNIRIQNPTRVVVPKDKATIGFGSEDITNENYLTPTVKPTINWNYKPSADIFSGFVGASGKFYLQRKIEGDSSYNDISNLYTDNVLNVLNRDTSIIIPIGKPENTFVKSQDSLKTSPNYLRTGPIKPGSVTWVYRPIPTGVANKDLYQQLLTNTIGDFVPFTEPQSIQVSKQILNRTGLEGKDEKTIYPSSSIISKETYGEVRAWNNLFTPENIPSLTTASSVYNKKSITQIDNAIDINFTQNIPKIYEVPKDIVEGKQKTTTLSSLNPQYFKYNEINNSIESEDALPFNNTLFNLEKTYGISTTEWKTKASLSNPNISVHYDDINKTNILQPTGSEAGSQQNDITKLQQKDLVKFYFEINNNDSLAATQNWFLFFRAYLNDLGDNYKPDWQSYKYIGRAENFYKYGGFSRDISLGFTIYAHSRTEMKPIYEKLNYLVGTTAPDYSEAGYMRGNFVNLTIGNYLDNVPGIIQGIDLKPSFDAGWDIDRNVNGVPINSGLQLPRMIDVTLQFTPIHTFTPRFTSTFIG